MVSKNNKISKNKFNQGSERLNTILKTTKYCLR